MTTGDTSEFSVSIPATNGPALFAFTGPLTQNGSGFKFNLVLQTNVSYRIQGFHQSVHLQLLGHADEFHRDLVAISVPGRQRNEFCAPILPRRHTIESC